MIDKEMTIKYKGYDPDFLLPQSGKKVCCICNNCGKIRWIPFRYYRDLCSSCAQKLRIRSSDEIKNLSDKAKKQWALPKPQFVSESDRFISGTGIDRIETIKKFGYDPVDLKVKSRKKVITICQQCGESREVVMASYRNLCGSCAIKNRFKNKNERKRLSDANKKYWDKPESRIKQSVLKQKIKIEDFDGFIGKHSNRDYVLDEKNCVKLNKRFKGSCAHHITSGVIIYIPKDIHKINHSIKNNINMKEINKLAIDYLMGDI